VASRRAPDGAGTAFVDGVSNEIPSEAYLKIIRATFGQQAASSAADALPELRSEFLARNVDPSRWLAEQHPQLADALGTIDDGFDRPRAGPQGALGIQPTGWIVPYNALSLKHEPFFKALPLPTQEAAQAAMEKYSKPDRPWARQNLVDLLKDNGFSKQLGSDIQKRLITLLDADPEDREWKGELLKLARSPHFQALPANHQGLVLDRMLAGPKVRRSAMALVESGALENVGGARERHEMLEAVDWYAGDPRVTRELEQLGNDKNFTSAGVGSEVRCQVLSRIKRAQDPAAVANIRTVATSEGFAKLGEADQQAMLDALAKKPANAGLARDLADLANNGHFQALKDQGLRGQAYAAYGKQENSPQARKVVHDLVTSPGFGQLGVQDQKQLLAYVAGDNQMSGRGRGSLEKELAHPDFGKDSPSGQASRLRAFLETQRGTTWTTRPPEGWFDRSGRRSAYRVGSPTDVEATPPGSRSGVEAKRYDVTIDAHSYPVTVFPAAAGARRPTIDEIAKALAAVPKVERTCIKGVDVAGSPDPKGAFMTAGGAGRITVYPTNNPSGQTEVDHAILHETGHIVSMGGWGDNTSRGPWADYRRAMTADRLRPSQYPTHGGDPLKDDFAEFYALYMAYKGTPAAEEYRALFPNRLDFMAKNGF
jgi:hypothetical protein